MKRRRQGRKGPEGQMGTSSYLAVGPTPPSAVPGTSSNASVLLGRTCNQSAWDKMCLSQHESRKIWKRTAHGAEWETWPQNDLSTAFLHLGPAEDKRGKKNCRRKNKSSRFGKRQKFPIAVVYPKSFRKTGGSSAMVSNIHDVRDLWR